MNVRDLRWVDVETCERLSTLRYGPAPEGSPHALKPVMASVALVTAAYANPDGTLEMETWVNCDAFGKPPREVTSQLPGAIFLSRDEAELFAQADLAYALNHPLVTFNGRRFDIPVLAIGYARHRQKIPNGLKIAFDESRYKPVYNLDIFDRMTGFKATSGSLSEFSRAFGIADPKETFRGGAFEDLCNPYGLEDAIVYNRGDVAATYQLWDIWRRCK